MSGEDSVEGENQPREKESPKWLEFCKHRE
jgi:hypothetical protein